MRCLIFGCGYLGRRAASAWIAKGHEVFAVTRSEQNALIFRSSGINPIIGDICVPASLQDLPKVDVVLHAVGFDRSSGRTHAAVTCGGTQNILQSVTGRTAHLIHVSSTSVYGQTEGEWVNEDSPTEPTSPGGQLCVEAEQSVRDWARHQEGVSGNILRLAGIYGPSRMLSRIESLKAGNPIDGRGDSWLNLIHVDDAVTAVIACSESNIRNETINVVDDRPVLRSEYYGFLASMIGAPAPTFDPGRASPRGSGGVNKRCCNERLRQMLNWYPLYPSIITGLPASIQSTSD